jgi:hypothetical protein
MNRITRHHVDRRSVALERLESITAGAAIAGVAGTIGFGALAAMTFSGTASAASDPQAPAQPDFTFNGGTSNGNTSNDDQVTPIQPNTDDGGSQFFQVAPAPRTSSGHRSHAATGGSG